jgi:hypothetical protein
MNEKKRLASKFVEVWHRSFLLTQNSVFAQTFIVGFLQLQRRKTFFYTHVTICTQLHFFSFSTQQNLPKKILITSKHWTIISPSLQVPHKLVYLLAVI